MSASIYLVANNVGYFFIDIYSTRPQRAFSRQPRMVSSSLALCSVSGCSFNRRPVQSVPIARLCAWHRNLERGYADLSFEDAHLRYTLAPVILRVIRRGFNDTPLFLYLCCGGCIHAWPQQFIAISIGRQLWLQAHAPPRFRRHRWLPAHCTARLPRSWVGVGRDSSGDASTATRWPAGYWLSRLSILEHGAE